MKGFKKTHHVCIVTGVLGWALLLSACAGGGGHETVKAPQDAAAQKIFRDAGVEGVFVLLDMEEGLTIRGNPDYASRPFLPASTFKIPNTIIGLETGVIPNASFTLPWDGVRRSAWPSWNRDHDLRSAMKHSVVWYYQEVARRIGESRYRDYLARFDYGNRDISGGIDRFWLNGGLRITPKAQVRFLTRLMRGDFRVRKRHIEILRRILLTATGGGVTLRAKTGMARQDAHQVGWLVGFVEADTITHVFACLVLGPAEDDWRASPIFRARREVPLQLLKHLGAVPETMVQPE
jgi:beta-lactamase class D